jgi:N-acetylmuramoyl-L-alanine amidase
MNYKKRTATDYIVIHGSGTTDEDIGAAELDRKHRAAGWFSLGYHYVIRRDGTVETGRTLDVSGTQSPGFNHNSIAVCMVGGGDADDKKKSSNNFTEDQFQSLWVTLKELKLQFPEAEIVGHRDLPNVNKACPGFDVREWVKVAQLDKA